MKSGGKWAWRAEWVEAGDWMGKFPIRSVLE